jgi:hypothetical protein
MLKNLQTRSKKARRYPLKGLKFSRRLVSKLGKLPSTKETCTVDMNISVEALYGTAELT